MAVIVSGGKQYRVAAGDRILVDRLAAEPGQELTLDRVLLHVEGDDFKVGAESLAGITVAAKVIAHRRGPKIDSLRYKSKKHVRVHRGARADLTALEIISIGPHDAHKTARAAKAEKAGEKTEIKAAAKTTDKAATRKRAPARKKAAEKEEPEDGA